MITRRKALSSIEANVSNTNLIKHMLATEAIMRALARHFGENEDEWGLTGLLHDIDVELTANNPEEHCKLGSDIVRNLGATEKVCHGILCHNVAHGVPRETLLDKALFCADPMTGLITAGALVRPDKKLSGLTVESLMKRFNEKRFAAGVNREQLFLCKDLGLELDEFIAVSLDAMKEISEALGL
jgi:putative nucleotidyltransferase with HDIG domain